jgi:hypothetical protein
VHYFEASMKREFTPSTYRLRHFRLHTVPNFDVVRAQGGVGAWVGGWVHTVPNFDVVRAPWVGGWVWVGAHHAQL